VHALGNVAVFDTGTQIPAEKIAYALNARLPEEIRIQASKEVAPDFHPRHCESRKTYEYRIYNAEFPIPTERLYSYFTYVNLNTAQMQEAASYLVGTHDFKSFCSVNSQAESTVRQVDSIAVEKTGNLITIRVVGRGFLYNMVRIIAGTLMEVGRGHMSPQDIAGILEAKDRSKAGPTAPACGLTLIRYDFL
jgi:tRNA pseudouridine38-40 synthase